MQLRKLLMLAGATFALSSGIALPRRPGRSPRPRSPAGADRLRRRDGGQIDRPQGRSRRASGCSSAASRRSRSRWCVAALEMGSVSYTGTSALIPEARGAEHALPVGELGERDFVTDNHALPVMKKLYEAKGLVMLGLGEVGWNDVVCKKACLTPADVKGMKVRVRRRRRRGCSGPRWTPTACRCRCPNCSPRCRAAWSRPPTCRSCTTSPRRPRRAPRTT